MGWPAGALRRRDPPAKAAGNPGRTPRRPAGLSRTTGGSRGGPKNGRRIVLDASMGLWKSLATTKVDRRNARKAGRAFVPTML